MIDDEEDEFRPDMEMSAFQRNAAVGALKVEVMAMTKCKKVIKQTQMYESERCSDLLFKFMIYAKMLGICNLVTVQHDAKLIDAIKLFIIQVNNDTLNKIDVSNVNSKSSITSLLTVSAHDSDYRIKCLLNYEDSSAELDMQMYAKNIKCKELDISYKMYGDVHYSINGNFTAFSPQKYAHKKSELSRQSTTMESRDDIDVGREDIIGSMSKASLLSHYAIWVMENTGIKKERVLGIDQYGLYVYKQKWVCIGNKNILEGGEKLIICMSCILAVKPCKMSSTKFMVYYINKKAMKECRLFVETQSNKVLNEIASKMKSLLGSVSFNN